MRRSALLLALALAAAGCMGGDAATLDSSELKGLVLQPGDLSPAFERFDEGPQARIDQPGGTLARVGRFGRQGGWKARYRRPGTSSTSGPLVIESKADVFEEPDGARDELRRMRSSPIEGLRVGRSDPGLGDESFIATGTQGSGRFAVRSYLVGWRWKNATASVLANGFEGKLTRAEVVELARLQQARLDAGPS